MHAYNTAARTLERARDSLVNSGADVGPFVSIPYTSDRVAAYRDAGRIRYEIVYANGDYSQHTFADAARTIARAVEY